MTVKTLLHEIDSHELAEWEAFDRIEPIDHAHRAELSAGILASTMCNIHRDHKSTDPYSASDFMVQWDKPYRDEVQEWEQQRARVSSQIASAAKILERMRGN